MAAVGFLLMVVAVAQAAEGASVSTNANPIRKVVTMLQNMVKKVEAEGVKETALYDKFMCYCKTSGGDLSAGISAAEAKIPSVSSSIEEGTSKQVQLKAEIKAHQDDRTAAKAAMAKATSFREKEAAAFAAESAESTSNINALTGAIAALEKGMGGAFLQTNSAQIVRKIALASQDMLDVDRQEVMAFLSSSDRYSPASGEITGILKQMNDEMSAALADATAAENAAIKSYGGLMAAKTKEVNAATQAIENKVERSGDLAVELVQMKEDLDDTEKALAEDKKFLADMAKNCATKSEEWDAICKTRSEELLALAETIKVLNDDDAMELFKKTLPSASASFMQVQVTKEALRSRALSLLRKADKTSKSHKENLDLVMLVLSGKTKDFGKVIKMIDDMVALLEKEQADDDAKKEDCEVQLDTLDDNKKALERSIQDTETAIAETKEALETVTSEIKALGDGIAALDKAVAEATEQRKEENADFKELLASDSAAVEVLGFAKNRLNKFYNPKLYVPAAKRELSEEERLTVNMGGTLAPTAAPGGIAGTGISALSQINLHSQNDAAPPPPPEAPGAYSKKSEESGGVIAMIDLLIADLDKELTEAKTGEADAQAEYEQTMKDSAAKRAQDSETLTAKASAKADTEQNLQSQSEKKAATTKELMATLKVIQARHAECDWLLQYFGPRKEARTGEVDSLKKAKAVLSGADYSLLQTNGKSLRTQK